ncbi:MAG: gluconate 2-dehydrogenase subunit 3 family protein [Pseudomonadota bacterium]
MRRHPNPDSGFDPAEALAQWHQSLVSRRRFLLSLAGGSLAALFGPSLSAAETPEIDDTRAWRLLDAVQQHLFPSEAEAPGAREINALAYLRFVVGDPKVDAEEREFIVKGAAWLEGMANDLTQKSFLELDEEHREQVLRRIVKSKTGENWVSTLLLYLMEALLTDPAYGGNPGGVGWRWLEHVPGFPRPTKDKTYPGLLA